MNAPEVIREFEEAMWASGIWDNHTRCKVLDAMPTLSDKLGAVFDVAPTYVLAGLDLLSNRYQRDDVATMVYVWTRVDRVFYVGRSYVGTNRLAPGNHHRLRNVLPRDRVWIYVMPDRDAADRIEREAIDDLQPLLNRETISTTETDACRWFHSVQEQYLVERFAMSNPPVSARGNDELVSYPVIATIQNEVKS